MRKVILSMAMGLLLVSCGGGQASSTSEEPASPASEKAAPATAQKKSNGDVLQRVEQIYQDVFSMYAEASEDESPVTDSPDEKYCSKSWNELLAKVIDRNIINPTEPNQFRYIRLRVCRSLNA